MWSARIFTLYPEMFPGPLNTGLYGKALEKKLWNLQVINIRDSAIDKHKTVDDTPFGGGNGMLLKPDVLGKSIDNNTKQGERIFYLSPKGKKFDQEFAKEISKEKIINLICGHFEGIDERVLSTRKIEEISIGDYILSGGESASFVFLDAVLRLLPGILGNDLSKQDESFENGLLEYPQYTKPQIWEKKSVPEVLLSGDHAKIKDWRLAQSKDITRRRRPDLWEKYLNKKKKMKNIEDINKAYVEKINLKKKIPDFFPGDTIRVGVRIVEGKRERIQNFEGICIAKKNRDINSSFTVRKISFGEGVERTFALYSPVVGSIKVVRSGKVRRAKLYYLRDRKGKSARIAEKIKKNIGLDVETKAPKQTETTTEQISEVKDGKQSEIEKKVAEKKKLKKSDNPK